MAKMIVASNNRGKVREYYAILPHLDVELLTPADLGLTLEIV